MTAVLAVTVSAASADPPIPNPLFKQSLEKGLAVRRAFDVAHRTLTLAERANASGETASLTEPVGLDVVYLAQLVTSKFIPVHTPVGMRMPMHCTSSGRAWLSMHADDTVRTMLAQSSRMARTPFTLTAVDAILERVVVCRQIGCASNCEELFLGDMGIAAPIRGSKGQALGAVHLSPPTSRWTLEEAQKKLSPMVIERARAISQSIAH